MLTTLFQDATDTPKDQEGEIDVNTQSIIEKIDTWLDGFIRNVPNIVIGIALFYSHDLCGTMGWQIGKEANE